MADGRAAGNLGAIGGERLGLGWGLLGTMALMQARRQSALEPVTTHGVVDAYEVSWLLQPRGT